jgi:hypothetical protein
MGGGWRHWDLRNVSVDEANNMVSFNLAQFGYAAEVDGKDVLVPHDIFSIVLEKSLGRIDDVVFDGAHTYTDDPDVSYMEELDSEVCFRISDPAGVDYGMIRVYVDGALAANGLEAGRLEEVKWEGMDSRKFMFIPGNDFENLSEGFHTLKIEAWDDIDAIDENNWMMLEKTVNFYIDCTAPAVVTHTAQRDGVRYFSVPEGAVAAITIVDEGVGLDAVELQKSIFVDVFKHLTPESTPMRVNDQGDIINYQRKTLVATSRAILEYADDYTPDGIDNETWVGIHDGASDTRHQAWRASYTVYSGQIADGDTYEVVFYAGKCVGSTDDHHNENAVYLYEDLTRAYLRTVVESAEEGCCSWAVDVDQLDEFYKDGLLDIFAADPFTGYYESTFLEDILGNNGAVAAIGGGRDIYTESADADASVDRGYKKVLPDHYFVRHLVADKLGPVVDLVVPDGVTADDLAATVSASVLDDASGIASAQLIINGEVVAEKVGPASNISLDYTFGKGEAENANEIKVVALDVAGNETVQRNDFAVQEMDAPEVSDMTPEGDGVEDATPTIAAAIQDASDIDLESVTLSLNGAVMKDITVSDSMVSYTPTEPLETGVTYVVKVSVKDKAGNVSEKVWNFALETVAPSITNTAPSGVDNTGVKVISADFADDGTGIDKDSAVLMVDSKVVAAEVTDSSVSYKPSSVLKSGEHTAKLTVADAAGNVATHEWTYTVEEDAPVISDVAPSGTINDDMPVLSGKYSDAGTGIDVGSVALTLNGEVMQAEITGSQVSYGIQEPLRAGVSHTVSVTVADMAGNVSTVSRNFTLESRDPVIDDLDPTGTVNMVDVPISANYNDGSGSGIDPSTALMKVDGVAVPATASASGISYQATGLMAGDHTVYVEVADQFGNVGSESWSFKV